MALHKWLWIQWRDFCNDGAHNNNIPTHLLTRIKLKIERNIAHPVPTFPRPPSNHTKWATFTYKSPQIRKVSNIFKHTNICIAFRCNNTLARLSKPTNKTSPTAPYDKCDIYSPSCVTCYKEYVGQTSGSLKAATKITSATSNTITRNQPPHALHILNNQHKNGPIKNSDPPQASPNTTLLIPNEHFF